MQYMMAFIFVHFVKFKIEIIKMKKNCKYMI